MSELYKFRKTGDASLGRQCPPPAMWGELAAGLMTKEMAFDYLEHAGGCADCAEELQYALFAIGDSTPVPEEIWEHLGTRREEWQRQFAEKMAGDIPIAKDGTTLPTIRQNDDFGDLLSRSLSRMVNALTKKKPTR